MALLDDVRAHLRITDPSSDALLLRLIDSAQAECRKYTGVDPGTDITESDMITGIILMVQADYDGDPARRNVYRNAAIALWRDHRVSGGGL